MKPRKRLAGGQPGNANARIYAEPMDHFVGFRVTARQHAAFKEQCDALGEDVSVQARELCLKFAGWKE